MPDSMHERNLSVLQILRLIPLLLAASMASSFMFASTMVGGWHIGKSLDGLLEYAFDTEIPDETSVLGPILALLALYAATFRPSVNDSIRKELKPAADAHSA